MSKDSDSLGYTYTTKKEGVIMQWKCTVCNLIWKGEAPPKTCPKCGVPGDKYNAMKEEEVNLVENSRFTNSLHVELLDILPSLVDIAKEGIEDDLDPRCVAIFERLLEEATFLEASIKAELEGHMKKGKWG